MLVLFSLQWIVNEQTQKRRYKWPWVVLAMFLLAILLAVLWLSHEAARVKHIRDLNSSQP